MATHLCKDLFKALKDKHLDCLKILILNGVDPNKKDDYGNTPLHYASWHGDNDFVIILISLDANVNEPNLCGWTPLHKAARLGHKDCIITLLENGADKMIKSFYGCTPITVAKKDEIKLFIEEYELPDIKEPDEN